MAQPTTKVSSRVFSECKGQGCVECGCYTTGRHYGLSYPTGMFSGWRGPYCSRICFRVQYPQREDNEGWMDAERWEPMESFDTILGMADDATKAHS